MLSSKKLTCKGTLRLVCIWPPPLPRFRLDVSGNFVGSESGQIQSVKLLQNMVSNTYTQHLHDQLKIIRIALKEQQLWQDIYDQQQHCQNQQCLYDQLQNIIRISIVLMISSKVQQQGPTAGESTASSKP
jgi:hypothetical protein